MIAFRLLRTAGRRGFAISLLSRGMMRRGHGDPRSAMMGAGRAALGLAVFAVALLAVAWFCMTQPLVGRRRPAAGRLPSADPERLECDVRKLCGEFYPRDFAHPQNLERAAGYLGQRLGEASGRVSEEVFEVCGVSYRNVLAAFGPERAERIVVGAHYDTDGPLPGADDNASGVAGLLELARLLGGLKLETGVELAAFALEEMPFFSTGSMGSAVHARALREAGVRVRAMVCLEMIGFFSDEPGSQGFPALPLRLFYPGAGNFVAVVGRLREGKLARRVKAAMQSASDLPVFSFNGPRLVAGVDLSDHRSFWEESYRAIMITDTAFYRNPNYHASGDRPETLDYGRMARVVDGLRAAVLALAR